jgi:methionyl-tRNA formyltransferase
MLLDSAKALLDAGHSIALVATAEPSPEYGVGRKEYESLAEFCGAKFLFAPRINDPIFVDALTQASVDVGVSLNWPIILQAATCDTPHYGILNAHAGDLPRYRGNACPNWAIINGETKIGLCVHRMEAGQVDAGPIYARDYFDIAEDTYIEDVYRWMASSIPSLFVSAVSHLSDLGFQPEDQQSRGCRALRCHPRRPEDSRINWKSNAVDIHRLIRASSRPFSGAFSWLEGVDLVRIWRACIPSLEHDLLGVPGQIMGRGPSGGVLVACGHGVIEIEESSLENGQPLPSANRFRLASWPARNQGRHDD